MGFRAAPTSGPPGSVASGLPGPRRGPEPVLRPGPVPRPVPVPLPPPPQTRTAWDRLDMQVTGVTGDLTLGQFLADDGGPGTPSDVKAAMRELADLRAPLAALTGLST